MWYLPELFFFFSVLRLCMRVGEESVVPTVVDDSREDEDEEEEEGGGIERESS